MIKFIRCKNRKKVFINKIKFKETNVYVTETLTFLRMAKLKDARDKYKSDKFFAESQKEMTSTKVKTKACGSLIAF